MRQKQVTWSQFPWQLNDPIINEIITFTSVAWAWSVFLVSVNSAETRESSSMYSLCMFSAIPGTIPDTGPLQRAANRGVNQLFVSQCVCVCLCGCFIEDRGDQRTICVQPLHFLQQESRVKNPFCWKVEVSVQAQVQFKIYIVVRTANQVVVLHNEILIMFTMFLLLKRT